MVPDFVPKFVMQPGWADGRPCAATLALPTRRAPRAAPVMWAYVSQLLPERRRDLTRTVRELERGLRALGLEYAPYSG